MSDYKPVEGRLLTLPFMLLGLLAAIGFYFMGQRFMYGIGAVTNLEGGYAWGIWVVFDIVIGTAFACGGYALALTVYVLNKGKFHPLIRPAVTASLLGYLIGGFGAFFDMGRYWQFYNVFLPWQMNFNSVMLEVGLCVAVYILVLFVEFAPALLERWGKRHLLAKLNKVLFIFIALGVLLPTMHQSSLGSLLIAMGYKVHPLWQSMQLQPLLAILTALIMGFSVVVFEGSFASVGLRRPSETPLLARLSGAIKVLLIAYLAVRFAELLVRGKLGLVFAFDLYSLSFLVETLLFALPLYVLFSPQRTANGRWLMTAAMSMLLAGSLYRLNAFLIGFNPGPGYSYYPSVPEILVTIGVIAFEIMIYLVLLKKLPVMHSPQRA